MRKLSSILLTLTVLVSGCSRDWEEMVCRDSTVVCAVGLSDGMDCRAVTKNAVGSDGVSVNWENDDNLYLWARRNGGTYALSGQEFKMFGSHGGHAYFTSTLGAPMAEGSYNYFGCSPCPDSMNGTEVAYAVPQVQDGRGEGIMMLTPLDGGRLMPLSEYDETQTVSMEMEQMLHLLQLYVADDNNLFNGERLSRIELTFSGDAVGNVVGDVSNPDAGLTIKNGGKQVTLDLPSGLEISANGTRHYAYATIVPKLWSSADKISAKVYSATKMADMKEISLGGRNMQRGHATPVRLQPKTLKTYCWFAFTLKTNPIGEDLTSIKLTAPEGCKWGTGGTNTYVFCPGGNIAAGTKFLVDYYGEDDFRALSGKTVTVTFESEHLLMTQRVPIEDLSSRYSSNVDLHVPELLAENFDQVGTFSSNDEYSGGFISGSQDAYQFLNGWSGGRIGASAGKCIRIACRRETSACYDARVDSAPLNCQFKKETDLKVEFVYGSNNQYSKGLFSNPDVGQTCKVGYVTSTSGYKSGDTDGVFEGDNQFYTHEKTGSWSDVPNNESFILHGIPAGTSPLRITWRTVIDYNAGTTNTTDWLYLDNIKVTISK